MEMHHLGCGIWSLIRLRTGRVLRATVPAPILSSDWRGLGRRTSALKGPAAECDVVARSRPEVVRPAVGDRDAIFDAGIRRRLLVLVALSDPALRSILHPQRDSGGFGHQGALGHGASQRAADDKRLEQTFPDEYQGILAHVLGDLERGFTF